MGMTLSRPNETRLLVYSGGIVTRAVHATGKIIGIFNAERNPNLSTQVAAASLNAGTDTFAEAAATDADANAELSVFSGIDPATHLPWADHLMRPGPRDAVLHGITFLSAVIGSVTLKTFGSSNANSKDIITLTQSTAPIFQLGRYVRFGDNGVFVSGGFWFTTATAAPSFMLAYDVVER